MLLRKIGCSTREHLYNFKKGNVSSITPRFCGFVYKTLTVPHGTSKNRLVVLTVDSEMGDSRSNPRSAQISILLL